MLNYFKKNIKKDYYRIYFRSHIQWDSNLGPLSHITTHTLESNYVKCDTKFSSKSRIKNNCTHIKYLVLQKNNLNDFWKFLFFASFLFK